MGSHEELYAIDPRSRRYAPAVGGHGYGYAPSYSSQSYTSYGGHQPMVPGQQMVPFGAGGMSCCVKVLAVSWSV